MGADIFPSLLKGMLDLKIHDQGLEVPKQRLVSVAKAHGAAILSAGYQLMRLAKAGVKGRAPGDVIWPKLHTWSGSKTLGGRKKSRRRRVTESSGGAFFSRNEAVWPILSRAIKYRAVNAGGYGVSLRARQAGEQFIRVQTGFISGVRTRRYAAAIAEGQTITVTPKMRRFFFAHGIPLTAQKLVFPARPHMEPVERRYHGRLLDFIDQRVKAAASGLDPRSIKSMF
ncbi:MAG: hypothetical protein M1438_11625 [Deltaproteobacteria bacterium]|nr:hypothetical protein [Deltaproteobacteria bacterium]